MSPEGDISSGLSGDAAIPQEPDTPRRSNFVRRGKSRKCVDWQWLFVAGALTTFALLAAVALLVPVEIRQRFRRTGRTEISDDQARQLVERAELLLRGSKPFLDPEFDTTALAASLGTSEYAIAKSVQRIRQQSVADFIRMFRVWEADRLLLEPGNRDLSLEALGQKAGFRSQSAFTEAFRTELGVSPAERRPRAS